MSMRTPTNQDGITLLVTLLLMGVLLGVSASLLNLTLKQFQLSGIAYTSETAFQAASAGIECALYHDFPKTGVSPFEVPGSEVANITCMNGITSADLDGNTTKSSGEEQRFQFSWGATSNPVCTELSVYKFYSLTDSVDMTINGINMNINRDADLNTVEFCPQGSECTIIQSRGYNVACADITTSSRVVEREYTKIY